jgi:hypothetical protein
MFTEIGERGIGHIQGLRLSEALFQRTRSGFSTFAALSSNVKAIEASLMFSNGLAPFVVLVGPSGWGKTHLLEAAATVIRREFGVTAKVQTVAQWADAGARWDQQAPLLLDDTQEALSRSRLRQAVRFGLERRVQAGRPTMLAFTAPKVSRAIKMFLPVAREWHIAPIGAPTPTERELVTRHLAGQEGISLANPIYRFVSRQTSWDGNAIIGALGRLKLMQTRWTEPEDVLRALGFLEPYLIDNAGCDLRDQVFEAVSRCLEAKAPIEGRANLAVDLSVYFMIDRMGLSEGEVASYFRISPGEVYGRASRIAKASEGPCPQLKADCLRALVASLD